MDVCVHIENQLGFVGYDVSIVGYCRVWCMLVWYDVSIIGYCRVWYGILHMHAWLSVMMLMYGILQLYGMLVWYDVSMLCYGMLLYVIMVRC